MQSNKIYFLSLLLVPTLSWAIFCPTNFNQIDFGASIDQVIAQCGKPDKMEKRTTIPEGPQEWSYFIPQPVSATGVGAMEGTLKTQMTFDSDGKAVNISVNGIGVGATTICGRSIQLGDTRDAVKAACGDPSFINRQNASTTSLGSLPDKIEITTFTYNSTPPVTLVFENGVFKTRQ